MGKLIERYIYEEERKNREKKEGLYNTSLV